MPRVYRTFAVDEDNKIVLELWGRAEPSRGELEALVVTADDFRLPEIADVQTRVGTACRGCGCTTDRACPGGCSWAEPDLCSACSVKGVRRA
jgi:hypothetical protein